ncbi:WecB/TagA/CpsF family glycosyltransferase [Albibacterium sp.]|uniref:WecB/TagA/CpsF family glycosyltransferase n=1 Tax=Albibacterium sp. TaxID=2952885 RepID=UPI002BC0FD00|nr:WecB/TagA/CpsF family glycosyltransferase [Albibacterium sp.]HUH17994.1 WecB/TagA/CpsF family glycosyltransferase [Albibacterium sp.]
MSEKVLLFGIPIDALTIGQTVSLIKKRVESKEFTQHVVVNAGKIAAMQRDETLRQSVLDADIINADGMAVVWASHFSGKGLPARVAGIDLMLELVKMAHEQGYKCFFFGAKEEVVTKVCDIFSDKYSNEIIGGFRNGYYHKEDEVNIVTDIAKSGSHMLFVAMSSPQKEIFVNRYKGKMNVAFVMGVGGSFDVVAGKTKRAPVWMQGIGLEWFYRLMQEPRRMWKRYLFGNFEFVMLVIKDLFKRYY